MRKNILTGMLIILFALLFPYIYTMMVNGKVEIVYSTKIHEIGKSIILSNENGEERIDVQKFIPCMLLSEDAFIENEEFLKVKIIIYRTFLLDQLGQEDTLNAEDIGLSYSSYGQLEKKWGKDFTKKYELICRLIAETEFEVLKYEDKIIKPYFHEISAGATRDGGDDKAYLAMVESTFDLQAESYLNILYFTYAEFVERLEEYSESLPEGINELLEKVKPKSKDSAGYVTQMSIVEEVISGGKFQNLFGLPSTHFEIEEFNGGVRIICKGKGSGYGLSINGALKLAEDGKTYKEIFGIFYKNITIVNE